MRSEVRVTPDKRLSPNTLDLDQRMSIKSPADVGLVAPLNGNPTLHTPRLNNSFAMDGFHNDDYGCRKGKRKWIHDILTIAIRNIRRGMTRKLNELIEVMKERNK